MPRFIFAEGDSWFSAGNDILAELKRDRFYVKSEASAGDTLATMNEERASIKRRLESLKKNPATPDQPDVFLLSAGGNDLVDRLPCLLNDGPCEKVLNVEMAHGFVEKELRDAYTELLNAVTCFAVEIFSRKIPIVIHGYAYPVPDGRRFYYIWGSEGPWLKPKFQEKGHYDLEKNTCAMKHLVDKFNSMLDDLADQDEFSHVTRVDLRECLTNDLEKKRYQKHWSDELHPTLGGTRLIKKKFKGLLVKLLNIRSYEFNRPY